MLSTRRHSYPHVNSYTSKIPAYKDTYQQNTHTQLHRPTQCITHMQEIHTTCRQASSTPFLLKAHTKGTTHTQTLTLMQVWPPRTRTQHASKIPTFKHSLHIKKGKKVQAILTHAFYSTYEYTSVLSSLSVCGIESKALQSYDDSDGLHGNNNDRTVRCDNTISFHSSLYFVFHSGPSFTLSLYIYHSIYIFPL